MAALTWRVHALWGTWGRGKMDVCWSSSFNLASSWPHVRYAFGNSGQYWDGLARMNTAIWILRSLTDLKHLFFCFETIAEKRERRDLERDVCREKEWKIESYSPFRQILSFLQHRKIGTTIFWLYKIEVCVRHQLTTASLTNRGFDLFSLLRHRLSSGTSCHWELLGDSPIFRSVSSIVPSLCYRF